VDLLLYLGLGLGRDYSNEIDNTSAKIDFPFKNLRTIFIIMMSVSSVDEDVE